MRNIFISLVFSIIISIPGFNQTFDTDTLQYKGNIDNRINLVFLSDGYLANDLDKFLVDVQSITDELFTQPPWLRYNDYFNIIAIKVPSNQSGASLDPDNLIDNYFGSSYFAGGIERLLVPYRTNRIHSVLADNFPEYDQVFMVVNSDKYGGSGGWVATASTNTESVEIAIHELAHSFAGLGDEYWAGSQYAREKINMTQVTNPDIVKWKHWMYINGVGIYAHDPPGEDWYRPHNNCKMRYLGRPFCYVCREALAQKILSIVDVVESYSPETASLNLSENQIFSINTLKPEPNTIRTKWYMDEEIIASNTDSVLINPVLLDIGAHLLRLTVLDTVRYIAIPSHFTESISYIEWNINVNQTGIDIKSDIDELNISVYPNPGIGILNLEFSSGSINDIKIEIIDITGKKIFEESIKSQPELKLSHSIDLSSTGIQSGMYILKINNGVNNISRKIIIE